MDDSKYIIKKLAEFMGYGSFTFQNKRYFTPDPLLKKKEENIMNEILGRGPNHSQILKNSIIQKGFNPLEEYKDNKKVEDKFLNESKYIIAQTIYDKENGEVFAEYLNSPEFKDVRGFGESELEARCDAILNFIKSKKELEL